MTTLIAPLPGHRFHNDPDELLKNLIVIWRRTIKDGSGDEDICRQLINDAYKVLGYRCALKYIERYGVENDHA